MKGQFWPFVSTRVHRFWKTFPQVRAYFDTQFPVQPNLLAFWFKPSIAHDHEKGL